VSKAHADASPSSSEIWLACPASVTKARGITRVSSSYMREGTAAHTLAEMILKGSLKEGDLFPNIFVDHEEIPTTPEMIDAVVTYTNYVRSSLGFCEAPINVETRVHLNLAGEDIFGTVDAWDVAGDHVEVMDFKYGQGHSVPPDAPQLKIYGLGVLNELGPSPVNEVTLTVVQPRIDPDPKSVTIPVAELLDWEKDVLAPAVAKLAAGDTTETPGSHCRWCVRASECQALAVLAQTSAKAAFEVVPPEAETLSDIELAEVLNKAEIVAIWISKVRAEATARADAGHLIPGWKLVPKRATRRWSDTAAAVAAMKKLKLSPDTYTRVETLTNVEKALKSFGIRDPKQFLEPFVSKISSGSTLVSEEDGRIAIDMNPRSVFQIELDDS
jgi:hypothetical protein